MATKKMIEFGNAQDARAAEQDEKARLEREERQRKFPHVSMEARYQHTGACWIMIGSDNQKFADSQFYAGMLHSSQMIPHFVKPVASVSNAQCYMDREAAHIAMTLLLNWYKTTGADLGIEKPRGLCIGY